MSAQDSLPTSLQIISYHSLCPGAASIDCLFCSSSKSVTEYAFPLIGFEMRVIGVVTMLNCDEPLFREPFEVEANRNSHGLVRGM